MLRITIQPTPNVTTFKLEGKLGGPWVQDLEELWQRVRENALNRPVRVDLTSVLLVDKEGKRVLKALHEDGAELVANDAFMRSVVQEMLSGRRPTEISDRVVGNTNRGRPAQRHCEVRTRNRSRRVA